MTGLNENVGQPSDADDGDQYDLGSTHAKTTGTDPEQDGNAPPAVLPAKLPHDAQTGVAASPEQFVGALHRDTAGYVETRSFGGVGPVNRHFDPSDDVEAIVSHQRSLSARGFNVGIGVATRREPGNGQKGNVAEVGALWADVDAKDFIRDPEVAKLAKSDPKNFVWPEDVLAESKQLAWEAITRSPVQPSIVVDSGHGYHVYWLLESPVAVTDDQDIERIESLNRRLAATVGGDTTSNIDRILRAPGTVNRKPGNPVPCEVVYFG